MTEAQARAQAQAALEVLLEWLLTDACAVGLWQEQLKDASKPFRPIIDEMKQSELREDIEGAVRWLESRRVKREDQRRKRKGHPPNVVYLDLHR
jgi:hypothetical protein